MTLYPQTVRLAQRIPPVSLLQRMQKAQAVRRSSPRTDKRRRPTGRPVNPMLVRRRRTCRDSRIRGKCRLRTVRRRTCPDGPMPARHRPRISRRRRRMERLFRPILITALPIRAIPGRFRPMARPISPMPDRRLRPICRVSPMPGRFLRTARPVSPILRLLRCMIPRGRSASAIRRSDF